MQARRGITLLLLAAALGLAGCKGMHKNKGLAASEPPFNPLASGDAGAVIVTDPAATNLTWVDRHPLFSKPRQYYQNTDSNALAKGAAATFVGVPAGMMGEMKQIVVGRPANPAPY